MLIKIYCTDLAEAVSILEREIEDGEIQGAIEKLEEGEILYLQFGEIEI